MWLGSSAVRVLARYARGPVFESWSAMWFFLPCDTYANNKGADHNYHLDVSPGNNSDSDARIFLSCIVKMIKLAKFRCRKTSARFENNKDFFIYLFFFYLFFFFF